jgi:hypothetical protein
MSQRQVRLAGSVIAAVFACCGVSVTATAQSQAQPPAADARAIMQKSLESFNRDLDLRRNYTYQTREVAKQLDGHGNVKSTDIRAYEVAVIDDQPRRRLIARNDQPLSADELQKEEERRRKAQEKNKAHRNPQKEDEEERKFARLIMDTYNFALVGEELIDGEAVWIVQAEPNPANRPNSMEGRLLKCMHGRLWISKRDYQWARVDAEMLEDFSVGWFLAKLHKGAHIFLDQARINEEIWLPRRELVNVSVRIGFKSQHIESETTYSNYKKFRAESHVTDVREAPAAANSSAPKP